ncbi:hypothetical protein D9M71_466930 [compost metagenome]
MGHVQLPEPWQLIARQRHHRTGHCPGLRHQRGNRLFPLRAGLCTQPLAALSRRPAVICRADSAAVAWPVDWCADHRCGVHRYRQGRGQTPYPARPRGCAGDSLADPGARWRQGPRPAALRWQPGKREHHLPPASARQLVDRHPAQPFVRLIRLSQHP